jgi:hypothetical protein
VLLFYCGKRFPVCSKAQLHILTPVLFFLGDIFVVTVNTGLGVFFSWANNVCHWGEPTSQEERVLSREFQALVCHPDVRLVALCVSHVWFSSLWEEKVAALRSCKYTLVFSLYNFSILEVSKGFIAPVSIRQRC